MLKASSRSAFTLVELLIVITIIGILSVALIPRLVGAPARARDAQRRTDMQTFATALELYADDEGSYPTTAACVGDSTFKGYLTSYLNSYPVDPMNTNGVANCNTATNGGYLYVKSQDGYLMIAKLENAKASGPGIYQVATPASPTTKTTRDILENDLTPCDDPAATCEDDGAIYVVGR